MPAGRRNLAEARLGAFFTPSRRAVWGMAGRHGLFIVAPVVVSLLVLSAAVRTKAFAIDFDRTTWVASARVLAGASPYVGPHSSDVMRGDAFVYPALMAILSIPFALLPHVVADALFSLLCVGAVVLSLRLCGVRDWRVYGLVFLWPSVISGWETANVTLLLILAMAASWRYRDQPHIAGALVALLVAVKLFLWPLGIWLLATRRYRAAGWAAVIGVVLSLMAWSLVGFDQIGRYVQLINAVTKTKEQDGYSLLAFASGAGRMTMWVATAVAASIILAGAIVLARRGEDRRAFMLCIASCLLVTPLVWLHYFALLIVPLALARPSLALMWVAPVLMWFPPTGPTRWQVAGALIIAGAATTMAVLRPSAPTANETSARRRSQLRIGSQSSRRTQSTRDEAGLSASAPDAAL